MTSPENPTNTEAFLTAAVRAHEMLHDQVRTCDALGWRAFQLDVEPVRRLLVPVTDGPLQTIGNGVARGCPRVEGYCPACSRRSLFLGAGARITCGNLTCSDPTAVDELVDPQRYAPAPTPCPECGNPEGPCDFLCVDPGCDARDCQSHETCEPVPWLEHHHEIDSGGNCRDPKCGWNSDEARERELFGGPYPGDPPGTYRADGPMCVVPPAPRDPNLREAADVVAEMTGPAVGGAR